MKNKMVLIISSIGAFGGIATAILSGISKPALSPAYNPAASPYPSAIYAEGIVESAQTSGENINIYPEVAGTVKQVLVTEGQEVKAGRPLLLMDDSIQRATVEQLQSQAEVALTVLEELKAQPRKETLQVANAQVAAAQAAVRAAQDALDKQKTANDLDPKSISKDALDSATNAVSVAQANLEVAEKQYELTKAGAWVYDIRSQERQSNALLKAHASSIALLSKYTLRAPQDGIVLAIHATGGSFVSAQGTYDTYTQGMTPVFVLGSPHTYLNVRCYVDEILVPRIPCTAKIKAQMSIRGSDVKIPLEYVRIQPIVSPKIELSNQRQERVDVRVLPIIFRLEKPKDLSLYPGQLVDVYIGE